MSVVIRHSDYLVARNRFTVEEYVNELSESFIEECGNVFFKNKLTKSDLISILKQIAKIKEIYYEDRKNEPGMFQELLKKYFEDKNSSPEDIDYIIYTRGNPVIGDDEKPYFMRDMNVPYFLQKEFNLKNASVFSIEQECSATLLAIKLAQSLIQNNSARRVLILSSSFLKSHEQRMMGLFTLSDGIGVVELGAGDTGLSPADFAGIANGSINRIQDFTHKANEVISIGVDLIQSLLNKNNLGARDISLFIPQNTNSSAWNLYSKHLNISKEQIFFDNFRVGHVGDIDMIMNITDIRNKNLLAKGDFAIAYALGTGASWNALLLKNL